MEAELGGGGESESEKERGGEEDIDTVVAVDVYGLVFWDERGAENKDSGIGSGSGAEVGAVGSHCSLAFTSKAK